MSSMKKDRMFQYATSGFGKKIFEDTGLITKEEAHTLWDKYYPDVVKNIENDDRPQMCIWMGCDSETDYSAVEKEIDYRDDLKVKNGKIYKCATVLIN